MDRKPGQVTDIFGEYYHSFNHTSKPAFPRRKDCMYSCIYVAWPSAAPNKKSRKTRRERKHRCNTHSKQNKLEMDGLGMSVLVSWWSCQSKSHPSSCFFAAIIMPPAVIPVVKKYGKSCLSKKTNLIVGILCLEMWLTYKYFFDKGTIVFAGGVVTSSNYVDGSDTGERQERRR